MPKALSSSAKKILLGLLLVFSFVGYILFQRKSPTNISPAPTPKTQPQSNISYKDGQYTGSVADAFYGPVQVKAVIQGGRLTDVQFLQYPSDRSTSARISSIAMPQLTSEAIQAQSANVDIISGATQTSAAFQQSLSSALAQAQA